MVTTRAAARPVPPPTIFCGACRAPFAAAGSLPEHCPRCGWMLSAESVERMHVFACSNPGCTGRTSFSAGWMPTLARDGWVWTCWTCGQQQTARVPLVESKYLGYIPEEESPDRQADPARRR